MSEYREQGIEKAAQAIHDYHGCTNSCESRGCDLDPLRAVAATVVDAVLPPTTPEHLSSLPITEALEQRERNHAKWGDKSIENRPSDYVGWLPTLGEEFGEVCRALTLEEGDPLRLRAELLDLLAVAWMWIDSIDADAEMGWPMNRESHQQRSDKARTAHVSDLSPTAHSTKQQSPPR